MTIPAKRSWTSPASATGPSIEGESTASSFTSFHADIIRAADLYMHCHIAPQTAKFTWNWTVPRGQLAKLLGEPLADDYPTTQTAAVRTRADLLRALATLAVAWPNAAAPRAREDLEKTFERLFRAAEDIHFEDGMESPFSRGLIHLVRTGGEQAKELLTYWILRQKCTPEVASEALRWVGTMVDPPSRGFRRWLLERCLDSPSPVVRDGAALGLAAMDDPRSALAVRCAMEREQSEELKGLLGQVLAQLEE